MRVESVRFNNWRCFDQVEISFPLDANTVCLIGDNGTGKSTVLDTIAFAFGWLSIPGAATGLYPQQTSETSGEASVVIDSGVRPSDGLYSDWPINDLLHTTRAQSRESLSSWQGRISVTFNKTSGSPPELSLVGLEQYNLSQSVISQMWERTRQAIFNTGVPAYIYLGSRRWPSVKHRSLWNTSTSFDDLLYPEISYLPPADIEHSVLQWVSKPSSDYRTALQNWKDSLEPLVRDGKMPGPPPEIPVPSLRLLEQLAPGIRLLKVQEPNGLLLFTSHGRPVRLQDLSSGEQDSVALAIARDVSEGSPVVLFDEPELHVNPYRLRERVNYLSESSGQSIISSHSWEVVERADHTVMLWRESVEGGVQHADVWEPGRTFTQLSGLIGIPAISMAGQKYVLVEGEGTPGRSAVDRFRAITNYDSSIRFLDANGSEEVKNYLERLIWFTTKGDENRLLRIGAIIDRDFMNPSEVSDVEHHYSGALLVLETHDEECLFLHPESLDHHVRIHKPDMKETSECIIRNASDETAGWWISKWAKTEWRRQRIRAAGPSGCLVPKVPGWEKIVENRDGWATQALDFITIDSGEGDDVTSIILKGIEAYGAMRDDADLWKRCIGKKVFSTVAQQTLNTSRENLMYAIAHYWQAGEVPPPPEVTRLKDWILDVKPVDYYKETKGVSDRTDS
jgi:energy-coupling factor transporter ATP-binding protein EcfA2